MKKFLFGLAAAVAITAAAPALAQEKIKACFLYVGSKTDGGWTQAHDLGRQLVDKELGDKVETVFLEIRTRTTTVARYGSEERSCDGMPKPSAWACS